MTPIDQFVTVADTEIHYTEWGTTDAPPVVCVHALSRVGSDFDFIAERLADDYYVVCPDMPGRGLSQWADDPDEAYTPASMSALLVEFCDALEFEEVRWIGTSMGGMLGMGLAAGPMADRITHLVCNDVGPAPAEDESADEGIDRIIEYLTNPPAFDTMTGLEGFYRETYATFSEMTDDEWRDFTVNSARRRDDGSFSPAYDPNVVEPLLTAESNGDPWDRWDAIDAELFVLRGERSDILSSATFDEMLERQPEAESMVIDCGHAPSLNVPGQIDPIREFLAA